MHARLLLIACLVTTCPRDRDASIDAGHRIDVVFRNPRPVGHATTEAGVDSGVTLDTVPLSSGGSIRIYRQRHADGSRTMRYDSVFAHVDTARSHRVGKTVPYVARTATAHAEVPAPAIDSALASARLGTTELAAPDTMRQGHTEHVRIQVSATRPESLPPAPKGMRVARDTIRVTDEMRATLLAPGFRITAASDSVQIVPRGRAATWEYDVVPLGWGDKELTALVSQYITEGGRTRHLHFPRTTLRVTVHVDPVGWASVAYEDHQDAVWKWIAGGGLLSALTWLATKGRLLLSSRGSQAKGGG